MGKCDNRESNLTVVQLVVVGHKAIHVIHISLQIPLLILEVVAEVVYAPSTICQQSAHKYAVASTICSVDLVIVLLV